MPTGCIESKVVEVAIIVLFPSAKRVKANANTTANNGNATAIDG